jgi:hypothetical protein
MDLVYPKAPSVFPSESLPFPAFVARTDKQPLVVIITTMGSCLAFVVSFSIFKTVLLLTFCVLLHWISLKTGTTILMETSCSTSFSSTFSFFKKNVRFSPAFMNCVREIVGVAGYVKPTGIEYDWERVAHIPVI